MNRRRGMSTEYRVTGEPSPTNNGVLARLEELLGGVQAGELLGAGPRLLLHKLDDARCLARPLVRPALHTVAEDLVGRGEGRGERGERGKRREGW